MTPLREFLRGRRGSQKEEFSYITSYLKLNIPPQEAVQMLQKTDEEKAVRGLCLPVAVGTIMVGDNFGQNFIVRVLTYLSGVLPAIDSLLII